MLEQTKTKPCSKISDRFDAGALTPTEACDASLVILELQATEGTQLAATIAPSREDPRVESMCTVGRFTTVTQTAAGSRNQFRRQVLRALKLAHRKALG